MNDNETMTYEEKRADLTITRWVPCDECDGEVLVTGGREDEFQEWTCDECDRIVNNSEKG